MNEPLTCHFCQGSVQLVENLGSQSGLGSIWMFQCHNESCPSHESNLPFPTKISRAFMINCAPVLGCRTIGGSHAAASKVFLGVARGHGSLDFSVQTKRIVVSGNQNGMKVVTNVTQGVGYIIVGSAWNTFFSILSWVFKPCDKFQTIFMLQVILSGLQRDLIISSHCYKLITQPSLFQSHSGTTK